jgi:hypothetical protein
MMVPIDLLSFLGIVEVKELHNEWQIILREKAHLIPEKLSSEKDVVLDGFCNTIPVLSHGFSTKPLYLVNKRRRWKR